MSNARLYVEVTSSGEEVFQLRRADGGVIILEAKQPEEVNRGDRVEMGSVTNSGKFCLANTFLMHRAPHKQLPAPNHSKVATSRATSSTRGRKEAYPKKRPEMEVKKAKKVVKAVQKAKARLSSGKKMTAEDRRNAIAAIEKASARQCPFEKRFTLCKVKGCPFHHQNREASRKQCFRGGQEVSEAKVVKWLLDHQWGFIETKGGVRFFFHGNQLMFDGRDIMIGSSVKFQVRKVDRPDKLDEAIKVSLN